nr:hypothetical protein CFP56_53620 [Quercus suber]
MDPGLGGHDEPLRQRVQPKNRRSYRAVCHAGTWARLTDWDHRLHLYVHYSALAPSDSSMVVDRCQRFVDATKITFHTRDGVKNAASTRRTRLPLYISAQSLHIDAP